MPFFYWKKETINSILSFPIFPYFFYENLDDMTSIFPQFISLMSLSSRFQNKIRLVSIRIETSSLLKEFISMTFDHPYFDSILNQNKNDQKVIEEDFLEK